MWHWHCFLEDSLFLDQTYSAGYTSAPFLASNFRLLLQISFHHSISLFLLGVSPFVLFLLGVSPFV